MKRTLAACALCALALTACGPKNTIDADAMAGVMEPVLDRHDHYVNNDPSLADVERESFLRSSTLVREMVDTARNE